jgi:hypothetical protein
MFPELRPHIEAAFDAAPEGAELCITGISGKNPGKHLKRIIASAGVKLRPKAFVNWRAIRETARTETYPIETVVG